jgi:Rieske Fe-S protein
VPDQKLTRRQALGTAAVAGVGVPLLAACGSNGQVAGDTGTDQGAGSPTAGAAGSSGSSGSATVLGKASDVPVGGGKVFTDANVVVTQPVAGTFKGFDATCTHQGCQVSAVANGTINCACHGSKFSIKDGSVVNGPASRPLQSATVSVQGADIVEG